MGILERYRGILGNAELLHYIMGGDEQGICRFYIDIEEIRYTYKTSKIADSLSPMRSGGAEIKRFGSFVSFVFTRNHLVINVN